MTLLLNNRKEEPKMNESINDVPERLRAEVRRILEGDA